MSGGRPDTVEEWAPLFTKNFSDKQILNPAFAVTFDHCKLCDCSIKLTEEGNAKDHLARHKAELKAWRKRRATETRRKQKEALALARRGKKIKATEEED